MPSRKSAEIVDHDELVAELNLVEKLSTAERLKHARKRRQQQLKKFIQYEKQLEKDQLKKAKKGSSQSQKAKSKGHVVFVNNICLLEAAARNDVPEVRILLEKKVSPDVTNEDGLTALHQCCIDDLKEMLELLLKFGANVNARDSELWTPLHAAATCGHVHLCKILIDHGAELLAVNADGNMPYDICEDEGTLDFIENEMAKRGVTQEQIDDTRLSTENKMLADLQKIAKQNEDLEFKGRYGETPLHIAAANGYEQVAEFLLSHHVIVDMQDSDGWQPIHAAACWGHLPVLEMLIQHGADLEAKTRTGETPFDICEDIEMRDRMMEIKVEMETKGIVRTRNLVRRRSTNTRSSVISNSTGSIYNSSTSLSERHAVKSGSSASVRRSSMREKAAISWKEALEEGRRILESSVSNEEEDDEERKARVPFENGSSGDDSSRSPEDVRVEVSSKLSGFMADSEHSDSPPPMDTEPVHRPEELPTKTSAAHPEPSPPKHYSPKTSPGPSPKNSPRVSPKTSRSKESPKPTEAKKTRKKSPPPSQPKQKQSASVQPVQVQPNGNVELPQETTPDVQVTPVTVAVPPAASVKPASNVNNQLPDHVTNRRPSQDFLAEYSSRSAVTQPMTLADLKKQRAKKMEASMRNKNQDEVQSQIENYNTNYSTGPPAKTTTDYQAPQARNSHRNGAPPRDYDEVKKYRFSDKHQVVDHNKEDTSCCLVQ